MAVKTKPGQINTTADVVGAYQRVADIHGIDADIIVANGMNRHDTLTSVIVYLRGTTGASYWTGKGASGKRDVIVIATQLSRLFTAEEIDATIQVAGDVLSVLGSGSEESIKSLQSLAKGNMPKGPQGIEPRLAAKGLRFSDKDEERGLASGRQRDNLRFTHIGEMDPNCKAIIEAVKSSYHGCTQVDEDGNELPAAEVNQAHAKAAAEREAKRLANEELAAEYKAKSMVKVNGMWMPASDAKILVPMFKDGVDKDALSELKAYQRGLIIRKYVDAKVKAATLRAETKAEAAAEKAAA